MPFTARCTACTCRLTTSTTASCCFLLTLVLQQQIWCCAAISLLYPAAAVHPAAAGADQAADQPPIDQQQKSSSQNRGHSSLSDVEADGAFRLELLELVVDILRTSNNNFANGKTTTTTAPAAAGDRLLQPKALAQAQQRRREPRFFGDSAQLAPLQEEEEEDQEQEHHEGLAKEATRHPPAQFSRVRTREEEERLLEEELRAEFVRVSSINEPDVTHRFRKKTYATMPRPFECYSCMSTSYQPKWHFLQKMYIAPKAFTDACDEPITRHAQIPTILCASFCVSMLEANVEAGIFVGFKYIRGCGDRILRHGFNQTAAQIYRLNQVDKCRQLPRERLFNQPRQLEIAITGDLQLCTCYGDRCNNNSPNSALTRRIRLLLFLCPIIWIVLNINLYI